MASGPRSILPVASDMARNWLLQRRSRADSLYRGVFFSFGVFQAYYAENYLSGYSPSDISWIGTSQAFIVFSGTIVSGPLFDRGYTRALLIAGAVLVTLGLTTASVARQYYSIFLSLGVCTGLGMSCIFIPSVAITPTWFTSKRPIVACIAATGSGVGKVPLISCLES